jgi:AcrR family transcriptional regulator
MMGEAGRRSRARIDRRTQVLDAAARLFAARGFHGVSIDDLGAAAGMAGPGLYRYFQNKDAVLSELLVSISQRLLQEGLECESTHPAPKERLSALVQAHVHFALTEPALITVQERDFDNLMETSRHEVRLLQRKYVEIWVRAACLHLRSDEDRTRAAVHATFGLINSTPHSARFQREQMAAMLTDMAMAALAAGATPDVSRNAEIPSPLVNN